MGEAIDHQAVAGVGDAKALKGGEDVAARGPSGTAFRQQALQLIFRTQGAAQVELDETEDQQRQPHDTDQGLNPVIVVQEDGADPQRALEVAMAQLDQSLLLVDAK